MLGEYTIYIKRRNLEYKLTLKNKITIILGESGTGKSGIIRSINDAARGAKIIVESSVPLNTSLSSNRHMDRAINALDNMDNEICLLDEDTEYLYRTEFQEAISKSKAYFLVIARSPLKGLNYSPDDIYELETVNNVTTLKPYYKYKCSKVTPNFIITEDSNSGYQFFNNIDPTHTKIIPADGRDNVVKRAISVKNEYIKSNVMIIADGAGFGSAIDLYMSSAYLKGIELYIPPSFEYILLHSLHFERIRNKLNNIFKNECKYIDSSYASREEFYTKLLEDITSEYFGERYKYKKDRLLKCFYSGCCAYGKTKCNGAITNDKNNMEHLLSIMPIDFSEICNNNIQTKE